MNTTSSYNLPALSNEGGLSAYLAQIKKFPMLDAEEEYTLAKNWRENGNLHCPSFTLAFFSSFPLLLTLVAFII